MKPSVTLHDLITAVAEHARTENEVIATIVHMVNSGSVRLSGELAGARIALPARRATAAA